MPMMTCAAKTVGVLVLCLAASAVHADVLEGFKGSVVRVIATKQGVDLDNPWQKKPISKETHFGTYVDDNLILVTATAVQDAAHLVMQKLEEVHLEPLEIAHVDYEVNLALVRPREENAVKGLRVLELAEDVRMGKTVSLLNDHRLKHPTVFRPRVSEFEVDEAFTSSYRMVHFLVDLRPDDFGYSEPVLYEGKLVGITTRSRSSHLKTIPSSIIKHYLRDVQSKAYRGFVDLDLVTNPLVSPVARKALNAEGSPRGVRVVRALVGGSAWGKVLPNDILWKIDSHELDELGRYQHPVWDKMDHQALMNQYHAGETITLGLVRDGKKIEVEVEPKRFDSNSLLIPAYREERSEPHLILGGMVLQELTLPFLQSWGGKRGEKAPVGLAYLFHYQNRFQTKPNERIVVLNRVLADPLNHGYEGLKYRILDQVNGTPVNSLTEIIQVLNTNPVIKNGKKFARLLFREDKAEVILSYDGITKSIARIANNYGIKNTGAFVELSSSN